MDADDHLTPEELAFRDEVRRFLDEKYTSEMREQNAKQSGVFAEPALAQRWHKTLYAQGWIAPAWPKEYGGPGWNERQRQIFQDECARVGTPALPSFGLSLCAPVIMRFGTPEQKAFYLPKILSGEFYFCQGYSEPQSGSDLASLQLRAERDGDHYVLNGSKIWTTHAHFANWMFLLARTSTEGKRQEGITFMVTPLNVPGITIRPIILISGDHEVNQVFFDNVRVPVANRFGEENQGWTVAKYLLEFERGGGSHGAQLRKGLDECEAIARAERAYDGGSLLEDVAFRRKAAELEIQLMAVDWTERRLNAGRAVGESVGNAAASLKKLMGTELGQQISDLTVEALGSYAVPSQRAAIGIAANEPPVGPDYARTQVAKMQNGRARTIYGGSSEVQRNILARVVLGS